MRVGILSVGIILFVSIQSIAQQEPLKLHKVFKGEKQKVLVYPPNDGFGGSHSQGASGKPTEYSDEEELLEENKDLITKKPQTRPRSILDSKVPLGSPSLQVDGLEIIIGGSGENYEGSIDRESVRRVMRAQEQRFRKCVGSSGFASGATRKIIFQFEINGSGQARNVSLKQSDFSNPKVEKCFVATIQSTRFPEPSQGGARVEFPLEFETREK
jgi:hypothetical protein